MYSNSSLLIESFRDAESYCERFLSNRPPIYNENRQFEMPLPNLQPEGNNGEMEQHFAVKEEFDFVITNEEDSNAIECLVELRNNGSLNIEDYEQNENVHDGLDQLAEENVRDGGCDDALAEENVCDGLEQLAEENVRDGGGDDASAEENARDGLEQLAEENVRDGLDQLAEENVPAPTDFIQNQTSAAFVPAENESFIFLDGKIIVTQKINDEVAITYTVGEESNPEVLIQGYQVKADGNMPLLSGNMPFKENVSFHDSKNSNEYNLKTE